tara:strand:- start:222 stop:386 length:165 start_codon:yes stop_codon:yes gene_type:complete
MADSIYDLNLHEGMTIHNNGRISVEVLKVPGGWIYHYKTQNGISGTFVPYNDEQ